MVVGILTLISRYNFFWSVGVWNEMLNSDAADYGGSGHGNFGGVEAVTGPALGAEYSLSLPLPPLGLLIFKREQDAQGATGMNPFMPLQDSIVPEREE